MPTVAPYKSIFDCHALSNVAIQSTMKSKIARRRNVDTFQLRAFQTAALRSETRLRSYSATLHLSWKYERSDEVSGLA
jgi:hypothetical protein